MEGKGLVVVERLEARLLFRWCEKTKGALGALLARKTPAA